MRRSLLPLALALGAALLATAPVPVSAQQDRVAETDARALFEEGRVAYEEGRFEDATRAFRRAYLLSPRYQLLYNIGQSELRAGHDARALEAFEAFLRQASADAPNRSEVEERARMLRSMGVTSATAEAEPDAEPEATTEVSPEPETTAEAPVEPRPTDEGPGAAPWILVAGGGVAVLTGAILMGVGVSESSRVTGATDGARWAELEGSASSANVLWGTGIGVAAVGLAAAGVGLAWALAGGSGERESGTSVRLRVTPFGLAVEGEL